MKKIIVILGILFFGIMSSQAQTITPDARLDVVYSEDYLQNLTDNNPEKLEYMNWYLDNSYFIINGDIEKSSQFPYLKHYDPSTKTVGENVQSINETDFNLYLYDFRRKLEGRTSYRIGDTGLIIVFESHKKLAEKFNKYKDEN
jgi:hypothetical protein